MTPWMSYVAVGAQCQQAATSVMIDVAFRWDAEPHVVADIEMAACAFTFNKQIRLLSVRLEGLQVLLASL